jgi:hypothetical protein
VNPSLDKALLELIDRRLREGSSVEIAGMGSFRHDHENQLVFNPAPDPLVFLGYAREDRAKVTRLFRGLAKAGVNPWMDCQKLLPGQNWRQAIEQTIELSDFFLGCFSSNSVFKRGQFQNELAFALDVATHFPQDDVFFIPVRLDDCELPRRIASTIHYVDLFPDWNRGLRKLISALRRHRRSQPRG